MRPQRWVMILSFGASALHCLYEALIGRAKLPQGPWGWVRFLWKDIKLELGFRTSEKIKQRDFE
jgi:hypothetical protein